MQAFIEYYEMHQEQMRSIKSAPIIRKAPDLVAEAVEARVPFTPSTQDPLHHVIGTAPSADNPSFFNICRQLVREDGVECSAFSPTGHKAFTIA